MSRPLTGSRTIRSMRQRQRPGTFPMRKSGLLAAVILIFTFLPLHAQTLPSGPVVLADGQVTLGGNAAVTVGPDDPGFFNYTDYDRSLLRLLQLAVNGSAQAGDHLTLFGHVRTLNLDNADVLAFYVRLRPWTRHAVDINVGRIPPTFGAFSRRAYGPENPLIGYPLAYQYLTSLRPDSLPSNADELLGMRGRGWLSTFTVGNTFPAHGMPLVSAFRSDTGIQVQAASERLELSAALTAGTVSDPQWRGRTGLHQFVARAAVRPQPGLIVGGSYAHAPFVTDAVHNALPDVDRQTLTQTTWGTDVEYSRDYYLIRAEVVGVRWRIPPVREPSIVDPLTAVAVSVEGRYAFRPELYGAARVDTLRFSTIVGSRGTASWEAPVTRVELGGGYRFLRNLQLKASYQHNTRERGRVLSSHVGAAQLMFWF